MAQLDPRASDPSPPFTSLGDALAHRYRIERGLGAGEMATVHLAEDVKHHRQVAITVLHAERSAVRGPERFLEEIEITPRRGAMARSSTPIAGELSVVRRPSPSNEDPWHSADR